MNETILTLESPSHALTLLGPRDQYLRLIRQSLGVEVTHREGQLRVRGEEKAVAQAMEVFGQLQATLSRRGVIMNDDVLMALAQATGDESLRPMKPIDIVHTVKQVRPRTPGQARYAEAIREHDLTFAIGPAGTGKTYLAVALAVEALKHRSIRKIVLVRPAVEAGESLGFLPGDLQAKINPYLRPLLDALHEMIDYNELKQCMEQGIIEVAPLAYMRGRTLNESFIILDEGQNTTTSQMKMLLTRMGEGSKIVISGDTTQVDLPSSIKSGLIDALTRLQGIEGVKIVELTTADIVRHRLVQDIVNAYEDPPRRHKHSR